MTGAIIALVSSYFIALVLAYTFRIPIPLAGYYGPCGEFSPYSMSIGQTVHSVMTAWLFYGLFGGFLLLPTLGAVAGVWAGRRHAGARVGRMITVYSILAGFIPVLLLSVLDYVIGPW